jgi:tetratricopeptide (TPR) repeat protein
MNPDESQLKAMELNQAAIRKVQTGDFNGAEQDLHQALVYSGDDPRILKNLGVVYFEKGVLQLESGGNIWEATRYIEKAMEITQDNPRYRRAYASALFQQAQYQAENGLTQEALKLYEKGAAQDPENINAWLWAADYAWKIQNYPSARTYLDKALEIDPKDERVQNLMERIQQLSEESNQIQTESEHFVLSADESLRETIGDFPLLQQLEEVYDSIGYVLGINPKMKLTVVLYPREEFTEFWNVPDHVVGMYDGKLRIPIASSQMNFESIRPVIAHEITHAVLRAASQPVSRLPRWFGEGLSQVMEGKALTDDIIDLMMTSHQGGDYVSLESLDGLLNGQDPWAYLKAFAFTKYLIDDEGMAAVKKLITQTNETQNFEKAFENIFHASPSELERRWINSL